MFETLFTYSRVLRRHREGPPLSANMPETPAPRGISVGRGGENR